MLNIPMNKTAEGYSIFTTEARENKIILTGDISVEDPGMYLEPFFSGIQSQITSEKIKNVTLDITGLDFINSSGIREIISWVIKPLTLPADQQFSILVLIDPAKQWQESTIMPICMLGKHIRFEKINPAP